MQTITIQVKDEVLDKITYLLKNLSDIEIVESKKSGVSLECQDARWAYWKEEELQNFGKIAIGLSKHDYDDEDYSKW